MVTRLVKHRYLQKEQVVCKQLIYFVIIFLFFSSPFPRICTLFFSMLKCSLTAFSSQLAAKVREVAVSCAVLKETIAPVKT